MRFFKNILHTTPCLLLVHQTQIIAIASNQFFTTTPAVFTSSSKSTCSSNKQTPAMSDNKDFKYESGTSSVAFVTTPDSNTAKKLAHGLVEQKLAACVNIIPNIQSIYMWEGKVNEDNEYLMMVKTQTSRMEELTKWIRDNHPYSVAEVIALPIDQGNLPYMKWLADSVPEKK